MILGTLKGRADDSADIYWNGVFLKKITSPFEISEVAIPDNTSLLAVRGVDTGGVAGFIIKLSNGLVTGTHWRCSNTEHNNWYKRSYSDDDWQPAITIHWPSNWGSIGLDPAKFIWAKENTHVVYCRGWLSKYQSQARYADSSTV